MNLRLSRRGLLASLLSACAVSAAQAQTSTRQRNRGNQQPAEQIDDPLASHFDLGTGDARWRVFVGRPKVEPPPQGYSAIVAVDGNATFPILWHLRQQMAPDAPVVLIAVGYPVDDRFDTTRRWFDLTSPGKQAVPAQEGRRGPGDRPTGGQQAFLDLIAGPVLDQVGNTLPLNRADMTLFGHSLGGLFVLNALFTRPELFARYAAADPSTWWNADEPLREARAFRGGIRAAGGQLRPAKPLLIANSGPRVPAILAELSGIDGLALIHRPHPDESHGSLISPAARQAMALHLGLPE